MSLIENDAYIINHVPFLGEEVASMNVEENIKNKIYEINELKQQILNFEEPVFYYFNCLKSIWNQNIIKDSDIRILFAKFLADNKTILIE